ncbi:cytochrome P450 family 2 subfamily E member 1 L homeolog [Xenopus laevis]|uniref:Cytochrome P450 family 2 subfamily E member 1 L homeolog n=1 Tax=Xenopus laevis TaxID=8355 RepID=Q6INW5_XENLA|nr:cytochrome P450 family 2 subfamily E member 1 L homeolog [Xenopus laevis]AAH72157.1 MGC80150 protein [Xenopus laevis]
MDPVSVLLSIVICIFIFKVFYGGNKESQNFPPGPKPLPLIGNLHMINMKKPHLTFMELAEKFGSVFSFHFGTEKFVVLCNADTVKDALINYADEFSGRPAIPVFDKTTKGHGIFFANGENWKVMRRFTISTLRDFGMGKKTMEDRICEESEFLKQVFESYKGKPFDNTIIMNAAVANIIVHILLNHRFDYDDATLKNLISIVSENISFAAKPIVLLYNAYPSILQWIPGSHKSVTKNMIKLYNFLRETFTKHRDQLDVNDQRDLIDVFLVKQQEESSSTKFFHDQNLTVLLADLFGAGMETTSTTLRWGLLFMMKYPEVQKKVQDEIDRVIGSAQPRLAHRKQMPYTEAVIHEIQRLGNLAPNVGHETTKDVTFRGYFIPKGTQVIILLTSVLQDKAYFKKPEEFYPEHFLDSEGKFVKNDAFLPFSAGRRSCAGETLAKMELFLFFTKLLQNFTFQSPPGVEVDLTSADALTSKPVDHKICALPRN